MSAVCEYPYKRIAMTRTISTIRSSGKKRQTVVGLGWEHGLAIALGWGTPCLRWAQARLGDRDTGVTELTKALATYANQYKLFVPLFQGLLAEIQAGQDAEEALARIDKALVLADHTGEHWTDALLHRIRGEILLKVEGAAA
jgi:hypothetical protein